VVREADAPSLPRHGAIRPHLPDHVEQCGVVEGEMAAAAVSGRQALGVIRPHLGDHRVDSEVGPQRLAAMEPAEGGQDATVRQPALRRHVTGATDGVHA
jgi:hypothetical protein